MRPRRPEDSYDFVELLLDFALQKVNLGKIGEREYGYLYEYATEKFAALFQQHIGVTHLEMPSPAAIQGVCDLLLHQIADFVLILTGLDAKDPVGRQISAQSFRREIYLADPYAEIIRRYAAMAFEPAVWQVTTYRLIE